MARDAALRGFKVLLLERGELGAGASFHQHGVLHSGARYVVSDPGAARECIEENHVLRRVAASVIDDTGGLMVSTERDDPRYVEEFRSACAQVEIPADELTPAEVRRLEPNVTSHLRTAFRVPDAHCDARALISATVRSAKNHGAEVRSHYRVIGFERSDGRIDAVSTVAGKTGEETIYTCDVVVNAAGAWAGQIGQLAGVSIPMAPDKGSMLVIDAHLTNSIVHRCHLPGDGDIIVPSGSRLIVGTTSVSIRDPDTVNVEPWEIDLLGREGDFLIPGLSRCPRAGAYAGVRPLLAGADDGRDRGRGFVLLRHGPRNGLENLLTIASGKLTTHRLMAEVTVDAACDILHSERPCRTKDVPIA